MSKDRPLMHKTYENRFYIYNMIDAYGVLGIVLGCNMQKGSARFFRCWDLKCDVIF